MYELLKVRKQDISSLDRVARILNACGKDMGERYNLHHWDNPRLKTFVIVVMCAFKNDIYLLCYKNKPVATFMTKIQGDTLHFEKLGTMPSMAGHGVGSMCMSAIEEIAKKSGCKDVSMEVFAHSRHAILFYEHRGYEIVGETDTLKYKEIIMKKSIRL